MSNLSDNDLIDLTWPTCMERENRFTSTWLDEPRLIADEAAKLEREELLSTVLNSWQIERYELQKVIDVINCKKMSREKILAILNEYLYDIGEVAGILENII